LLGPPRLRCPSIQVSTGRTFGGASGCLFIQSS
jgi:hypothetical protein